MTPNTVTFFEHMGDAERYVDKLFNNQCDLRAALFAARRDRITNPNYCTAHVVDIGDGTDTLSADYCYHTERHACVLSDDTVEVDRSYWVVDCCRNGVWERFEVYDGE
jgi:hypothetical protein